MSLPVLRETRMPAVICEIGPAAVVVEQRPSSPALSPTPWPSGRHRLGLRRTPSSINLDLDLGFRP